MGPDFTFFVVYGSVTHLVDLREVEVVEREFPLLTSKEVNPAIKKRLRRKLVVVGACIGTDAHTVGIDAILNIKGFAGEKGLEYYREITRGEPRRPGARPELVNTAREVRPTPCSSRRSSPRRTPTSTTPRRCRRLPRGVPRRPGPAARRRRSAVRGGVGGRASASTASSAAGPPRARSRPTSSTRSCQHDPARPERSATMTRRGRPDVTHRRYVPYSHAHYAGNLVDGAYSLAAFGDVATEMCIRTDGDEGLFASYSDVQFRAPVRAGDVIEIDGHARAGRDAVARDGVRGPGRRPRGARTGRASAADVLDPPVVATTARGVVVVPPPA